MNAAYEAGQALGERISEIAFHCVIACTHGKSEVHIVEVGDAPEGFPTGRFVSAYVKGERVMAYDPVEVLRFIRDYMAVLVARAKEKSDA